MSKNTEEIMLHLVKIDPQIQGELNIHVEAESAIVTGSINSLRANILEVIEDLVLEATGASFALMNVKTVKTGLTVRVNNITETTQVNNDAILDDVSIIFTGMIPLTSITPHDSYKRRENAKNFMKIDNCVKVLGFIAPLVLDKNLRVIDGNQRLELARLNGIKEVPAVVINDAGIKAEFLRLALNRSSEFQRWVYSEVDEFVDSQPQLQPLLEPLGFFGNKLLPVSYFTETLINYTLDEYNTQQSKYGQESNLAEWAGVMRERRRLEDERKKTKRSKNDLITSGTVSLFDLNPDESDFLETFDVTEEIQESVNELKELAGLITENYDEAKKAEYAETGREWQNSRRSNSMKAADARAAAEGLLDD